MNKQRTDEEKQELREALTRIAETQEAFWTALQQFEALADIEIDSTRGDFTHYTDPTDEDVESFIEDNNEAH